MRAASRADARHRAWRYRTRTDRDEIRWLRDFLSPGAVAVDAGAYKGGYTYWMRRAVGPSGRVAAFEPHPAAVTVLERMVDAFAWSNVGVHAAGLSSERGRRTLKAPREGACQAASLVERDGMTVSERHDVRVSTLDAWREASGRPVALIKVDVEGHELAVFRGATETLTTDRPYLLFECEARHRPGGTVEDVFSFLADFDYEGSFFWRGSLLPVGDFDVRRHQVEGLRPYANNFVFRPARSRG